MIAAWLALGASGGVPALDVTAQIAERTSPATAWVPVPPGAQSFDVRRPPVRRGPPVGLNVLGPIVEPEGNEAFLLWGGVRHDARAWRQRPDIDLTLLEGRAGLSVLVIREPYRPTRDGFTAPYLELGSGGQLAWAHFRNLPDLLTPAFVAQGALGLAFGKDQPRILVEVRTELVVRADRYELVAQTVGGELVVDYWPGSAALALAAGVGFR